MNFVSLSVLLKKEFSKKKEENSSYSLAKLTNKTGVSKPTLSGFFNQKRNLSTEKLTILINELINDEEIKQYWIKKISTPVDTIKIEASPTRKNQIDLLCYGFTYFDSIILKYIGKSLFKVDEALLKKVFPKDEEDKIGYSIEKLLKLNFIKLNHCYFERTAEKMDLLSEKSAKYQETFFMDSITRAYKQLKSPNSEKSFLGAFSIWIKPKDIPRFYEDYRTFLKLVHQKYGENGDDENELYRVHIVLTPEI